MENFSNYTRIIDLKEGQRNLNIRAIILEIKIVKTRAKQEDYYVLIIADQTAKVNCTLFDPNVALLRTGDIIYMTTCYTKRFRDMLTVYKYQGDLFKIGDMCMLFNEKIDMSEKKEAITSPNSQNVKEEQKHVSCLKSSPEEMKENSSPQANSRPKTFKRKAESAFKINRFALVKKSDARRTKSVE